MPSVAISVLKMQNPLDSALTASELYGKTLRSECFSLLRELQNADGGWPFHAGEQSRQNEVSRKAVGFLHASQLADGSWPAASQTSAGNWVTSLVCSVLGPDRQSAQNVKGGLKWLCEDFPRDSSPLQRFVNRLRPKSHII